ncbi:invasion associated locus B family protein [Psychromarinibacter halotolerans]|uniref:Invasion associated locus B family protein n=1 Tax=Psychromarinibacter halotolerans TaxID=1775175 RepID=A0ABV7GQA6_9RHOB|nr:invasion associated locus B family protein [Psychromarinibacter halotolerans]MAQ85976.1 hypothetical protein [Maritimibacter sp.]MDF0595842.1 invasion associated locus B family protein [Psychromarinibacter halotolerans]
MQSCLGLGALCAAILMTPLSVDAQESRNRVAAHTDWSVFEAQDPAQCWSVSSPKETVNTRDGRVVAVRRGDILLFVSYIPNSNVAGQVSFTGGYPFAEGSTVTLQIGDDSFELFTRGEMAWAKDPAEDGRIVEAMKGGAEAVLTARSSRGTQTEDTFSLFGFTAAVDEAAQRCSN